MTAPQRALRHLRRKVFYLFYINMTAIQELTFQTGAAVYGSLTTFVGTPNLDRVNLNYVFNLAIAYQKDSGNPIVTYEVVKFLNEPY